MSKIQLVCGANVMKEDLSGKTVKEVRQLCMTLYKDDLNVDQSMDVLVCGKQARDNHVLVDGETVEFVKASGEKGFGTARSVENNE